MKINLTDGIPRLRKPMLSFMRLFLFLFCTSVFSFSSANLMSQNTTIRFDFDQELTVDQIFDKIIDQTDYTFLYQIGIFEGLPKIKVKKGAVNANELLEASLPLGYFKFGVGGKKVIVIEKITQSNGQSITKSQQQITVKGTVKDESGMPLAGVNVLVKGTTYGTMTGFDGEYSLIVVGNQQNGVLVYSSLGYLDHEVKYNNQSLINVVLKESALSLDEIVVVSTGYQNISRERSTGSFSNIEEGVLDQKISQNFLSKIEGEVSGIVFDQQDGPTIRGVSTIRANNDPLIVVDGFPIEQGLNSINPNDIEKISVLKDAAAASIWGIRAANGVIVIVTKKGSKGQVPRITFSTNYAIQPKDDYNNFRFASTEEFLEFEKYSAANKWGRLPSGTNQPPLAQGLETYLKLNAGLITQQDADAIINGLRNVNSVDQFSDLFMANNIWSQQNVAISGGGEVNTYRASLTHNSNSNQNFFKNNDREEILFNIKNSIKVAPKLTFSTDVNYNNSWTKNNGMNQGNFLGLDQYQQILDANGNYIIQPRGLSQNYKESRVAMGYPYNWDYNMKQDFEEKNNKANQTLIRIQTALKYDITSYLSIEGMYQYEWGQTNVVNQFNEDTYYVRDLVNTFTTPDSNSGNLVSAIPMGEVIEKEFGRNDSHSARFQFNYDQSFNDGLHRVTSIGGYEVRQVRSDFNRLRQFGYDPQSLTFANIKYGERFKVSPSGTRIFNDPTYFNKGEDRFISYYGNAAYTYNNRYTVSGSLRLDDANLFGASKEYRNIPLYSVGGKWDISKENFFNEDGILNKLSLRATYGSNGNIAQGTSPYLQATLSRDSNTNNLYAYISGVKNNALRLEKTFVTNLGLDFGLFNNRINGSVEYYNRKSIDLLAPVSFSSTIGFNSALINAGEMLNTGVDLNLNGIIIDARNFTYNSTLNFSFNENEVTVVDVPKQTINTYFWGEPLVGKPLRYLYSYQNAGLDANGDPLSLNENGQLIDVNGKLADGSNGTITSPEALDYNGTTTPKYYGAWINNFNYKKFNLRVLTTFKMGHVFRNTNILDYPDLRSLTGNHHVHEDINNRWQKPGDEAITNIPRIPTQYNDSGKIGYSYYKSGNQFVDSASHIRLREIVLGYQLDNKTLTNMGIERIGFGFQVTNLAVFTYNKWDIDPESLFLPVTPTYSFNFTINF